MVKCGDWGCRTNQFLSHINVIYIYIRCMTTFICCGCAYGCVPTTLRLLLPTKLLEFCYKSGQLPADKSWWNVVIEAVDPTNFHLISTLYIYQVYDKLYMPWMCIWMSPHHHTATHADQAFGIFCYKSGQLPADKSWWNLMIEAVDPTNFHLTSMLYIYLYI